VPVVSFSAAAIGLFLNVILIPVFGGIGASISLFISLFVSSIVSLLLSRKADNSIKFKWMKMYLFTGLFFMLAISLFIVPDDFDYLYVFIGKIFIITTLLILFFYLYRRDVIFIREVILKNKYCRNNFN
jgi:O-antigen/teichoic acid export membrane protein